MPAYIQHREIQQRQADAALIECPCCLGRPMHVKEVEPHWNLAKIDFIFECSDCGTEIRQTLIKPERLDARAAA